MGRDILYSIGHSNKSIEELISKLQLYDIQFLIDVRSIPYSKYNPQFNREQLKTAINNTGHIIYGYMGDVIGGMPNRQEHNDCYTDGKVDYGKIRIMPFFINGLNRLIKANEQGNVTCIMCSEEDPRMCHRAKLIGEALREKNIILQHICCDANGNTILKSQIDIINEINKGNNILDLFGDMHNFTSRNVYKL